MRLIIILLQATSPLRDDIDIVAINDIFDKEALTYLLKYDTVMGRFPSEVSLDGDMLKAGQQNVKLIAERVPSELPWGELGVDIVVESTGIFRQRDQLEQHLSAGCKKVVLTVPAKDAIDYTVVLGVNDSGLKSEHKIAYLETVIKYIDGVLRSIQNRGWDIKNAIEWKKFEAGMM